MTEKCWNAAQFVFTRKDAVQKQPQSYRNDFIWLNSDIIFLREMSDHHMQHKFTKRSVIAHS